MNIVPKEIVSTEVASRIDIRVIRLELYSHAYLHVTVLSSDGRTIHSQPLTLQGDDYKAWSSDDSYLYTYATKKLGYTVAPATAPVAEPTPAPVAEPTPAPVAEPTNEVVDPVAPTDQ